MGWKRSGTCSPNAHHHLLEGQNAHGEPEGAGSGVGGVLPVSIPRAQAAEVGADSPREAVERVASLEHRYDASARVLRGRSPATSAVSSAKSASVSVNLPSGSPARESKPAEIMTSSGLKRSAAGTQLGAKRAENLVAAGAGREAAG